MTAPPTERLDRSVSLLREGYSFISNRCERFNSDIFVTRLMLTRVVCVRGSEAAKMFYSDRLTRVGAMPVTALKLLQDFGSCQMLDGREHRRRKSMFLSMMGQAEAEKVGRLFEQRWKEEIGAGAGRVVLFDFSRHLLTKVALEWAGLPVAGRHLKRRRDEFSAMIEGAGSVGPALWKGLWLRSRCESWARGLVKMVRSHRLQIPPDAPLSAIVFHRDSYGQLLDVKIAAVETINLLRATVAVSRFIVFAAKALYEHPELRVQLRSDNGNVALFAEETRRTAPFFPFIGGRVAREFDFQGHSFKSGDWVLLDLFGTNRDARNWPEANAFCPAQLRGADFREGFKIVPQGAGNPAVTHRCPGESLAVELIKSAIRMLTWELEYDIPEQDLSVNLQEIPALPKSGFVMTDVRVRG
jgi:fatty-acid peroxygenase